jgi:hypothetical protein
LRNVLKAKKSSYGANYGTILPNLLTILAKNSSIITFYQLRFKIRRRWHPLIGWK